MEEQESIDGIIYCYTNPVNGKKYVGQTTAKGWNRRHRQHRTSDKKYPLYYAFNKYGYDSFVLQILIDGVPTRSKLSELEIYYIELLDSYNSGYNQTTGGEGMRNYKMPSEVSEKISKANKGRKHSIDSRLLMSLRKKETAMRGSSHVNASRVQCVETGIIYPTLIEASKSVGGRSNSSIAAFLHGRAKTAHGYTWTTAIQDKPIAECPPCKPKKASGAMQYKARAVVCVETGEIFLTVTGAANSVGKRAVADISACCKGKHKSAYGHHWRYATEEEIVEYKSMNIPQPDTKVDG